jgi:alanyl-tRNA synthetase
MNSNEVRKTFFDFFESKNHTVIASAPMVIKDDPTLMFTNAGMNQFKNIFLGNSAPVSHRIANTQKCLRVSGKHNDLEEVGHDTYHHTMFEMLGNWSFGDYFKKEAIEWAWELLTEVYKINKKDLYVTVFGGDKTEKLDSDHEAYEFWKQHIPEERILFGSKKDNFWEMGDSGPCGPCSEIHADLRDPKEKLQIPGRDLVNTGHPEVIEIWNLVFIEFNRKADGSLEQLPAKHVDTGMGFERLNMVLQGVKSNYDTDIFQTIIQEIARITAKTYGSAIETDIAMRVIADHLRAVVFAIADGQLPSNIKAGYVIRRILRRAIRYGYTFLGRHDPFINELVPVLVEKMGDVFPEIKAQEDLIRKVITQEEIAFLRTLSHGIKKFENYLTHQQERKVIDGDFAFELFDTYGFPVDLTQLMSREKGWTVDMDGYHAGLEKQKDRSRQAAQKDMHDWIVLKEGHEKTEFVGYESLESTVEILRYRKITEKKKDFYQIILDKTPFYAESGGQVGDKGWLEKTGNRIIIEDTKKENDLIIHVATEIPDDLSGKFQAQVDKRKRLLTANNHSATHLMHAALRKVLGNHVEQKGSLVDEDRTRFDFSHFTKVTDEEILQIEKIVNEKIRGNIPITEEKNVPIKKALEKGAMALFGEKYGDKVRVISFDPGYSVELCGGTHVPATGQIGLFKIVSEGAIAAGVRRIEAITAVKAEEFVNEQLNIVAELKSIFKSQKDIVRAVHQLAEQNAHLQKQITNLNQEKSHLLKGDLLKSVQKVGSINFIAQKVELDSDTIKDLAFSLKNEMENLFLILGSVSEGKAGLTILISDSLVNGKGLNAGQMIREIAKEINGGGGGQPHFATAGGKNPDGLTKAFEKAKEMLLKLSV